MGEWIAVADLTKKVKCIGIGPAITPDGKRRMQISFGREMDPMKHQTPQGVPITYDNEVIVFLDEESFKAVKRKILVGEDYTLSVSESGEIRIR